MDANDPGNLKTSFKQGLNARLTGLRLADNPYAVRTAQHREWAAGWAATCDLDEDDDPESTRVKPGATDKDSDPSDDAI